MTDFEFQFTNGFNSQIVTLLFDDEVQAEFLARTDFSTGLAHIEILNLPDGKEVSLRVTEAELPDQPFTYATVTVDSSTPYYEIALQSDALRIVPRADRPGYL